MLDPFASHREDLVTHPAQKVKGEIRGLFKAEGNDFQTAAVNSLPLSFEGIPGDFHAGYTRRSGAREPWYERGTEMRNERQLSLLSEEELRVVARRLEIPELKSEWIGGNILIAGIPNLTKLPLVPLSFYSSKSHIFKKSWNKSELPLPFATVTIQWGEEIPVVSKEMDSRSEQLALELETKLDRTRKLAQSQSLRDA